TGVATANDFLRQLPQVLNFGAGDDLAGGASIQNPRINTAFARSVNLRGIGTKATLTLLNSHRIVPGSVGQLFDIDSIPAAAIERFEIVADGASAIYGADAVAGVANIIMRKPFNGAETTVRYGSAADRSDWLASQVLGKTWNGGGAILVYEHSYRDPLYANDRPNLYNDDLSPFGGAASSQNSSPGNLIFNGVAYAVPAGQSGQNLTLGQLGPAGQPNRQNGFVGANAIPDARRDTVSGNFEQHFGSMFRFFGDGLYSKRSYTGASPPSAANSAGLTVPSTNPFSPCAPGKVTTNTQGLTCPANGNVSVAYSFLNDLGPSYRAGYTRIYEITMGLEATLPHEWKATLAGNYGDNFDYTINKNSPNTAALNSVLGIATAAAKPANVPYFNPFCDGRSFSCNDFATLAYIRGYTENTSENAFSDFTFNANGPLFNLPAGAVRLAVGAEFNRGHLAIVNYSATNTPNPQTVSTTVAPSSRRTVKSVYGEILVPLIGEAMAIPGVRRLDLNVAGRFDDYSDFGSTTNPKVGVNWTIVEGFKLRGSYGKSFRAPTLQEVNPYAAAGFLAGSVATASIIPNGVVLPSGTLSIIQPIGGNTALSPERAKTFSLGADFAPPGIPGLTASVNFYKIKYVDKIDTAAFNVGAVTAINSGLYNDFLTLNPAFFPTRSTVTQAQFNTLVTNTFSVPSLPFLGVPPAPANVLAIIDSRSRNSGIIDTHGLDFSARYRWDAGFGMLTIGGDATYVMSYKTAPVQGAAILEKTNMFGYPLRWRGRFNAGWQRGGWSANAYVNYANGYHIDRTQIPVGAADKYLNISSYTTVDASLSYDTGDHGVLSNILLSLSVQNLFDKDPPLVLNVGSTSLRFDPQNASPIGRTIAAQITKRW
ncbi:MAG: TonB-dependent receptor, partial [Caulobacteraceae bacterium]